MPSLFFVTFGHISSHLVTFLVISRPISSHLVPSRPISSLASHDIYTSLVISVTLHHDKQKERPLAVAEDFSRLGRAIKRACCSALASAIFDMLVQISGKINQFSIK